MAQQNKTKNITATVIAEHKKNDAAEINSLVSNVVKQHLAQQQQKKAPSIEEELKAAVEEIATSKSSDIESMANATEDKETALSSAANISQPVVEPPKPSVDEEKKNKVV